MALSVADVWKLLVQSRLLTQAQCQQLAEGFAAMPGAATAPGKSLAEWLVKRNILSKYQAVILLAGRAGPFFYGDYKIYDRLENGRLAGTFRAVHTATNHPVLLRFLAGPAAQSPQAWGEILRWLPVTAHPNVVRCYEAVDLGSYKFLVMEDLRGQTLADVLEKSNRLPADEACRLGRLAALGLAKFHDSGRVHGDLRPHNLWLDATGNLKLFLDPEVGTRVFNVTTAASEADGIVRADYAAPEFLQPGRPADGLVDIYALGCTLYQLIAGQPPFAGGDVATKMRRHATEAIKPLDAVGAPPMLTQLVAYSMAKNPAVRFQQASILAEQLVQFIGAAQQNHRPAGPLPTQTPFELWLQQKWAMANAGRPTPPVAVASGTPQAAAMPAAAAPGMGIQVGAAAVVAPGPVIAQPVAATPSATAAPFAVGPAATGAPALAVGPAAPGVRGGAKGAAVAAAIKKRAKAKQRNNLIFLAFSVLAVGGALGAAFYVLNKTQEGAEEGQVAETTAPPATEFAPPGPTAPTTTGNPGAGKAVPPPSSATVAKAGPATAPLAPNAAADDGQTLWVSPTAGQPISLKYVPPGAQLYLHCRPAALAAHEEGARVLKALGPKWAVLQADWEKRTGVAAAEMEQLVIALYPNQGHPPRTAFVARLTKDLDAESLRAKWTGATEIEGTPGAWRAGEQAYYLPPDDPRVLVVGTWEPDMKDAAAANWKPPLLRREIGQLLQVSDEQRHATLLFAPNFLFGDGQELFAGDLARAQAPTAWFLGDGLKSGMMSLHISDAFYFEMRMESDIQSDRYQLASHVRERMAEVPGKIESYIAELNPHPYWRLVAFRFPAMIRYLHEHTRIGVDGNHAMLNAVLPLPAAHNLVFGGEMVLASAPGVAVAAAPTTKPPAPKNIEELLQAKISIAFAQDSLEFSMQNIVNEAKAAYPELPFDFQIKILGTDLEKDGITRNQQLRDFNQPNKSVAEILTAMVMKANPVTTVKMPNEMDQKLLWVIAPSPDNPALPVVLVTTRAAAEQKKYTLPEVFRLK